MTRGPRKRGRGPGAPVVLPKVDTAALQPLGGRGRQALSQSAPAGSPASWGRVPAHSVCW